jgi:hypothetical protein
VPDRDGDWAGDFGADGVEPSAQSRWELAGTGGLGGGEAGELGEAQ